MRCAATVTVEHPAARAVAAAVAPDHSDAMTYRATDETLTITIESASIGQLQATCDDTVVNLQTAAEILQSTHE
jgi:tRNA threonylcarbamoyladenosine modification (KEOPS) complex  Pcc1 subunit